MEEFRKIARYADQESRPYDMRGNPRHIDVDVAGKDRPETNCGHLRQMLLDSLPDDLVRWGTRVVAITPNESGCELNFPDGSVEQFDLVMGADGAWSSVRAVRIRLRSQNAG